MKTKTLNLYTIDELEPKAREKALDSLRDNNDCPFLSDDMNNQLHELLQDHKITDHNDTSKPNTTPTQVLYSLGSCQGDGACFEGTYSWKQYTITITQHDHRYRHKYTTHIEIETQHGNDAKESVYDEFKSIYYKICDDLESFGYAKIEYQDSEEYLTEMCEANEYTFKSDGRMENL